MAKPVNLNKARKSRARAEKRAKGDANAVKFGRTRAERQAEEDHAARAARFLDQHERDRE